MFRSDGTAAGTELVRDLDPQLTPGESAPHLVALGARGFWTQASALWVTDGTPGGTGLVAQLTTPSSFTLSEPVAFQGSIFVGANGNLYRSDGTAAGTVVVTSTVAAFGPWQEMGGKLYFGCETGTAGREICVTDGTDVVGIADAGKAVVDVVLGNGDGTFQDHNNEYATGDNPFSILMADLNGDHQSDAIVTNTNDGTVAYCSATAMARSRPSRTMPSATAPTPR